MLPATPSTTRPTDETTDVVTDASTGESSDASTYIPAAATPERHVLAGAATAPPPTTWWEDGRAPAALVVVAGALGQAAVVVIDLALTGRVSLFGDLCFVVVCLAIALAVRPARAFAVACSPPVLMAGTMLVLGATRPGAIAHPGDGVMQALVSGLARHSVALAVGFVLCLLVLGARRAARPS